MNTTSEKPNLVHQEKVEQLVLKDNNMENKRKVDEVCLTSGPLKDSERYRGLNTEDNKTLDFGENEAIYNLGTNYSNVGSESSTVNQEVFTEREVDYGLESKVKEKKLDRDEDKDDPQYIPKGGKFYEHDNRTSAVKETTGSKNQDICKANESNDKWYHDLYDDSAQFPKSIEELIEEYGYDIRNEEGPPPNALFRRYCSEPNMYTIQWEEEEACMNRVGGSEHIPSSACGTLLSAKKNCQEIEVRVKNGKKYMTPGRRVNTKETLARNQSWLYERAQDTQSFYNSLDKQQNSTSKEDIAIHTQYFWNLEAKHKIKEKDKTRGMHGIVMTEQYPARTKSLYEKEHDPQLLNSGLIQRRSSTAEEDIATLSYHFSEAVINVDNLPIKSQRVSSVPAAGNSDTVGKSDFQGKKRKSKRYSIQVQRSLPQGSTGPLVQQSPPVLSRHYQPLYIHIDEVGPGADMPERILSISNKSLTEHEFQLPPRVE